jgi:hypothetical protein
MSPFGRRDDRRPFGSPASIAWLWRMDRNAPPPRHTGGHHEGLAAFGIDDVKRN